MIPEELKKALEEGKTITMSPLINVRWRDGKLKLTCFAYILNEEYEDCDFQYDSFEEFWEDWKDDEWEIDGTIRPPNEVPAG